VSNAIEALGLVKRFGDVIANAGIDMAVPKGTVHGIVGENGAGKSTLLKMLFGFYQPDAGRLRVDGIDASFDSPADAMASGIGMVHQHFMLVEDFTVLENIILGAESGSNLGKAMAAARGPLAALEQQFGFDVPLDARVADLPVGVRQRVEILKAMYRGAEVLILDEPTAVLTPQETEQLFALIRQLRADGKTVLFVTHKLREIMAITDQVTVIRAGHVVANLKTADTHVEALAEAMVGARIVRKVSRDTASRADILLDVRDITLQGGGDKPLLDQVSLQVRAGEVLGVAGVAGNGQTELIDVLTGLAHPDAGEVYLAGEKVAGRDRTTNAARLRDMGLAHVAEDRLKTGVVESMSAAENIMLGYQHRTQFSHTNGFLKLGALAMQAETSFQAQDVRPPDPSLPIAGFSGGNQQKIVIARELAQNPDVMIIGQPTRGVDIGAVTLIHDQITALRNAGKAVLVVSADLDELLALSDRIIVMAEGVITGEVAADQADETQIGLMMAGGVHV